MAYDKQTARTIADRALAALEKEFGPGVVSRTMTKYGDKIAVTFDFTPGGASEKAELEVKNFAEFAPFFNLSAEHYKATFNSGSTIFELVGFKPTRSKYCIVGRDRTGKEMLFTEECLSRLQKNAA